MKTHLKSPLLIAAVMVSALGAPVAHATDYKLASGPDIGIRQIFEDGETLVLQFEGTPEPGSITARTSAGIKIPVQNLGRFVVLAHPSTDITVQLGDSADRIVTAEIYRAELKLKRAKEEEQRRLAEQAAKEAAERERLAQEEAARIAAIDTPLAESRAEFAATLAKTKAATTAPKCEEQQTWLAKPGETLRDTLEAWTAREGWTLVWDASIDYQIVAPISISACFADAITKVISAYEQAEKPLLADGHVNQKTLVVTLRK